VLTGALAVLFALGMASSAAAWTASGAGGVLLVAGGAEPDVLSVADGDPGTVTILDESSGFAGAVPAGCSVSVDDARALVCSVAGLASVRVLGGAGGDVLDVLSARVAVSLSGQDGDDRLTGGDGADVLDGGAGNDVLDGGGGDDVLTGQAGDDAVTGGAGADRLDGGEGADDLSGEDGDDVLTGGAGADSLDGGRGADSLDGGDDADALFGGDDADRLLGGAGSDRLDGGGGDDDVAGGAGDDALDGSDGRDTLHGEDGSDTLTAGPAGTVMDGGDGDDVLQGADGPDVLAGGAGADRLDGQGSADHLDGGDGDDTLAGGDGADVLAGGPGRDTVSYADAPGAVRASVDGVANDGAPGEGDMIAADVEALVGSLGDDVLAAGPAGTSLQGSDGNDVLEGGAGPDALDGGPGDDLLRGGGGADVLTGGEGTDTVTYDERRAAVRVSAGDGIGDDGAAGEHDTVTADVEAIIGGAGPDRLFGSRLVGGTLDGGAGDDELYARSPAPAAAMTLRCGRGDDRAHARRLDLVLGDCESVWRDARRTRYGVAAPGRPTLMLEARSLRVDRAGRVRVKLRCVKTIRTRCQAALTIRKRGVVLAQRPVTLVSGVRQTVTIRLTRRALGAFRARYHAGALIQIQLAVTRPAPARLVASLPLRPTSP
jgi:Ca2+-binding RTX toxin-like protein